MNRARHVIKFSVNSQNRRTLKDIFITSLNEKKPQESLHATLPQSMYPWPAFLSAATPPLPTHKPTPSNKSSPKSSSPLTRPSPQKSHFSPRTIVVSVTLINTSIICSNGLRRVRAQYRRAFRGKRTCLWQSSGRDERFRPNEFPE